MDHPLENVKAEIDRLREEIESGNYAYHVLANPVISDKDYDVLFQKLLNLERQYPQFEDPNSPTRKVGALVIEGFQTVPHSIPMLSLDNTYNETDIREFHGRVARILGTVPFSYLCELKIDGVSFAARFEAGDFTRGISRGNGVEGEDITEHIRRIPSFPNRLRRRETLEVRGEIYMPKSSFAAINALREEEGLAPFANPRNAAAGTLRQLDTTVVAKRQLDVYVYHLLEPLRYGLKTQAETLDFFKELGFKTEPHRAHCASIEEVIAYWRLWTAQRHGLSFDIDGAVIKVNEFGWHESLGATTHSPRWAIAFKFPAEQKETQVLSVEYSVGRTGVITPVANLAPVTLAGTTVRRASLHNFVYVREKDIRLGDIVVVEKAGDIIPQIVRPVLEKRRGLETILLLPEKCPVCQGAVGKEREEEVAIRCLNPICSAKLKRSMEIFVSRQGMNIEGLGERWIHELVEKGLLKELPDLYRLERHALLSLPRMGEKSVNRLLSEIEESKKNALHRLLTGLGIPTVGVKTAKELATAFKDMDRLREAKEEELCRLDGIGEEMARAIRGYFRNPSVRRILDEISALGVNGKEPMEPVSASLPRSERFKGLTFVITGTFQDYTREELRGLIEQNGGKVSDSVSKKTNYLLTGENPGSKVQKAAQLNTPIVNEAQWRKWFDQA